MLTVEQQMREWLDKHGEPPETIAMHPVTRKLAIPEVGDSLAPIVISFGGFKTTFIASSYLNKDQVVFMPKVPRFDFSTGEFDPDDLNGFVKLKLE